MLSVSQERRLSLEARVTRAKFIARQKWEEERPRVLAELKLNSPFKPARCASKTSFQPVERTTGLCALAIADAPVSGGVAPQWPKERRGAAAAGSGAATVG